MRDARLRDNTRRNIITFFEPISNPVRPIERSRLIPFQANQTRCTALLQHLDLLNSRAITQHLGF